MSSTNFPVVVIGAGPAGLVTAITLARLGVESLVVEQRVEPSSLPRATVVSTRSMELVRAWGLEPEMKAGGVDVEWLMWESPTLARAAEGTAIEIGLPTRAQAAVVSPTAPACVPQDHLERVLLAHLRSWGSARVELGTTFTGLEHAAGHVRVGLRDLAGRSRTVTARHVVGADGARSAVRRVLGIGMRGTQDVLGGITAVIRAPLWTALGEYRYGIYSTTQPGAEGLFLPAGPDDRWLFGAATESAAGSRATPDAREIVAHVRRGAGMRALPVRIERLGSFTSAAQIADRFRAGPAFLVGDAAHRVTPRGGTGMNAAIQGGHDLGWKLAWVLRGWAGADLLDSYELERRPFAAHNVIRSADEMGSRRSPGEELRVDLAGRIDHHWTTAGGGPASTLDLIGPGLTMFTSAGESAWREAAKWIVGGPPIVVRQLDEMTAAAMRIRPGGAMLVRPDGVPIGWWTTDSEARHGLEVAVARVAATGGMAHAA